LVKKELRAKYKYEQDSLEGTVGHASSKDSTPPSFRGRKSRNVFFNVAHVTKKLGKRTRGRVDANPDQKEKEKRNTWGKPERGKVRRKLNSAPNGPKLKKLNELSIKYGSELKGGRGEGNTFCQKGEILECYSLHNIT